MPERLYLSGIKYSIVQRLLAAVSSGMVKRKLIPTKLTSPCGIGNLRKVVLRGGIPRSYHKCFSTTYCASPNVLEGKSLDTRVAYGRFHLVCH